MIVRLLRRLTDSGFLRKVVELFLTRVVVSAIGIVGSVLVARALGPEGRGTLAISVTIAGILSQFGNFGLHASNTYNVGRNRQMLPVLLANSLMVVLFWCCLTLMAVVVTFFIPQSLLPIPRLTLSLALLTAPLSLAYLFLGNLLIGVLNIRSYNIIEVANRMLGIALTLIVVAAGAANPDSLLSVGMAVTFLSCAMLVVSLSSNITLMSLKPDIALLRRGFGYGLRAYLAALLAFLVIRLDVLMVDRILGIEATGQYAVAVSMADWLYMLPVTVGTILFPQLSHLKSNTEKYHLTRRVAIATGLIMLVLTASAASIAPWLIPAVYGSDFAPAVSAFGWLMPATLAVSVNGVFMNYFASIGMPRITIYSPAAALAANVIFNAMLLPQLGIAGAGLSSLLSYGLMLCLSLLYIARKARTP